MKKEKQSLETLQAIREVEKQEYAELKKKEKRDYLLSNGDSRWSSVAVLFALLSVILLFAPNVSFFDITVNLIAAPTFAILSVLCAIAGIFRRIEHRMIADRVLKEEQHFELLKALTSFHGEYIDPK